MAIGKARRLGESEVEMEGCELCVQQLAGGATFSSLWVHLSRHHQAYFCGLVLRIAAPFVFLVAVGVLAMAGAPRFLYLAAMLGCYALLFGGKLVSRRARSHAGLRPTLPIRRLLKEGGAVFLVVPTVALLVFLSSRS